MQSQAIASTIPVSRDGVCVVDGWGVKVYVERGRLVISDGIGPHRRGARFARATHGLRRLVLLGHTGFVTLEAIRWLSDGGVALVSISPDGELLLTSASPGSDDARLRLVQAGAIGTGFGTELARNLLRRKLDGQSRVAGRLGAPDAQAVIVVARAALDDACTPAELMVPEAAAARAYWAAWSSLPIHWARRDAARVPPHWQTFGTRASPLTGGGRLAVGPGTALVNFATACVAAEIRIDCVAVGLDPGVSILHQVQRSRASFVYDILEVVRPDLEEAVLSMLIDRTFRASDFHETRQGVCRILPPLTHELAVRMLDVARLVGPVVEGVAKAFAGAPGSRVDRAATPLTESNRSAGRDGVRKRPRAIAGRPTVRSERTCVSCGGPVVTGRRYCLPCRPDIRAFQSAGAGELAARRSAGHDPAHGGDVATIRGDKWRERLRLERDWDRAHGKADPEAFRQEILPTIRDLPPRRLVEATGLTRAYCARVLRGEVVPHGRWWRRLAALSLPTE